MGASIFAGKSQGKNRTAPRNPVCFTMVYSFVCDSDIVLNGFGEVFFLSFCSFQGEFIRKASLSSYVCVRKLRMAIQTLSTNTIPSSRARRFSFCMHLCASSSAMCVLEGKIWKLDISAHVEQRIRE